MFSFFSPYRHQFVRLGACVPQVAVAEPRRNAAAIEALLAAGDAARVGLMVFPELCLSAYAIDDLLFQDALLDAVEAEIGRLVDISRKLFPVFVVGAPLRARGHLYNCGVVIHRGQLLGIVPKVFLPNYREFYERRHFTSGEGVAGRIDHGRRARGAVRRRSAVRRVRRCRFHLSCRDLRGSVGAAAAEHRRRHSPAPRSCSTCRPATSRSARRRCAACCARRNRRAASPPTPIPPPAPASRRPTSPGTARPASSRLGEGLAETERFSANPEMAIADVDLGRIRQERMRTNTFGDCARAAAAGRPPFRTVAFDFAAPREPLALRRESSAFPMCRPTRRCSTTIATRPTTSRSRGWRSGSRRPGSKSW